MPVMAQEVTARDACIAELEAERAEIIAANTAWRTLWSGQRAYIRDLEKQRDSAEAEAIDLARRLADAENELALRGDGVRKHAASSATEGPFDSANPQERGVQPVSVKIAGHWTAPVAIPITEGPAPMPQNALDHSA
jgi:hypothetical protein